MGKWVNVNGREQWYYKPSELRGVAENYDSYGADNVLFWGRHWEEALDKKIDFDRALKSLSSRRRFVIEALMKGVSDYEMEQRGYYEVAKVRKSSFRLMAKFLSGGQNELATR